MNVLIQALSYERLADPPFMLISVTAQRYGTTWQ